MNKYLHGFFVMALETDTPKLEPVPAFLSFVPDLCARWKMSDHCVAGNWGYHNGGFSPSILRFLWTSLPNTWAFKKSLTEKFTADPFINGQWVSVKSRSLSQFAEGKTMGTKVCRVHANILKST